MKKGLLITSRVLLIITLLFCIFKTFSILADTNIFQITKIEVKEKSDGVVVNNVGLAGGQLQNDIVFSAKDEFVKYNITIKNTSNDDYTIKSITDNNTSTYLEYTYDDLSGIMVNAKQEKTFELQIKYVQEASGLYISDKAVSLTLTYEKEGGETKSEVITNNDATPASDVDTSNPNTGDNIIKYLIIGAFSLLGLIITIAKKKELIKTFAFIGLVSILAMPFGVKADNDKFIIKFTTNKIQNTHADLISGKDFNLLIHRLTTGIDTWDIYHYVDDEEEWFDFYDTRYEEDDPEFWQWDDTLISFNKATDEEYNLVKNTLTEKNIISTEDSSIPAYMWYEPIDNGQGVIYYYSLAKVLVMNKDSSFMFFGINNPGELDLSLFDTSNATNMRAMFYLSAFYSLNLGKNFDTLNVIDMSFMFYNIYIDIQEFSLGDKFDTSNVTDMSHMFKEANNLTSLDLGDNFNTSNVTDMSHMFSAMNDVKELDLGDKFDTSKVTDMSHMFAGMPNLEGLNLGDKFDTSNVTNMESMFNLMPSLKELDLGNKFNTSKVTDMSQMFAYSFDLETIYVSSDFDLSSLQDDTLMFEENYSLWGENGTPWNTDTGAEYARIDDPDHDRPGYFTLGDYSGIVTQSKLISGPEINLLIHRLSSGHDNLELVISEDSYHNVDYTFKDNETGYQYDYSNWVSSFERANKIMYYSVKDSLTEANIVSTPDSDYPAYLWYDYDSGTIFVYSKAKKLMLNENSSFLFFHLSNIYHLDMSIFDTSQVTDMSDMFSGDESLEEIYFGNSFNTSNVTNMSGMFVDTALQELDLSSFDTSNVTDMSYMFSDIALQELDLSNFDTSNVTNMSYMFASSYLLAKLNLGDNFDTSNVTNMSFMFAYLYSLTSLDLGDKFDTSNVTDMSYMFDETDHLTELNLGDKFDTSNVTNMLGMFMNMNQLQELNLGDKFNTSNVTNMSYMFAYLYSLTSLDLGDKFDTSNVTDMSYMFDSAYCLETIYSANDFNLSSLEEAELADECMFSFTIVGGAGTTFDDNHTDAEYARIDDPEHGRPGYFTLRQN